MRGLIAEVPKGAVFLNGRYDKVRVKLAKSVRCVTTNFLALVRRSCVIKLPLPGRATRAQGTARCRILMKSTVNE